MASIMSRLAQHPTQDADDELRRSPVSSQKLQQSKAELSARAKFVVQSVSFGDDVLESAIEPSSCCAIFGACRFRVTGTSSSLRW
jgi:hypothetical protein